MADFCKKCAAELGFEPEISIENLSIEEGQGMWALCETCGYILIANQLGVEVVYRADNAADTLRGRI